MSVDRSRIAQSCYGCHSGYGMWGDMRAKAAGMRHMLHTVLGTYDFPLELAQPHDIGACLACHAESRRFRGVEAHAASDIQDALLAGEMTCSGMCHPSAHPAEALAGDGSAS